MRPAFQLWLLLAVAFVPGVASAAEAVGINMFSTANVNMRAGPGASYRVISTVSDNQIVTVHGCVAQYRWCDIDWAGNRGWVSSKYLRYPTSSVGFAEAAAALGIPVVEYAEAAQEGRNYTVRAEPAGADLTGRGQPQPIEAAARVPEGPGSTGEPMSLQSDNGDLLGGELPD